MSIAEVLARLQGVTRTSGGYSARCPAHEDKRASLSVAEVEDRILLKCHAGCQTEDICQAIGIHMADLFSKRNGGTRSRSRIIAEYSYQDEQGRELFQVCRTENKQFPQRHKGSNGNWIWNIEGVRRVLYRLPELLKGIQSGHSIVIAEGEKDVLALVERGFTATCNPGGAATPGSENKWLRSYSESLRGADVIIVPDNDPPEKNFAGQRHAEIVADNLSGKAKRVRVVLLSEVSNARGLHVKDAYDFFSLGGTVEQLNELFDAAPDWVPGTKIAPEVNRQEHPHSTAPHPDDPATSGPEQDPSRASFSGVILPSGDVSISEAARAIFERIGPTATMFWRGGAIVETVEDKGLLRLAVMKPDAFRSRVEGHDRVFAWRAGNSGGLVLKSAIMSRDTACAILESPAARDLLPPIASVLRCPVLIETNSGTASVLGRGYHPVLGGLLVVDGATPPQVELDRAVASLKWLLEEFQFQSEGDRSRALAAFITPALRIGGFLKRNIPIDVAEADDSQAGKGYRHELVCELYNEIARVVTNRNGGVGSTDESLSGALVAGQPFICLDNLRGRLDSQNLEAFLTCPSLFPARIPNRGEVMVNPKSFVLLASSNGMEATRDLAKRSSLCRIRKRPSFKYRDTLGELRQRQWFFLGCVFSIISEWVRCGKPRSEDMRHDFTEWNQTLDWIVQKICGLAPLMDDHQAAQDRVCNPALSWVRQLAVCVGRADRLGEALTASDISELCNVHAVEIPGLRDEASDDHAKRQIGILMRRVFQESRAITVDGFGVTRGYRDYRKRSGDIDSKPEYVFRRDQGPTQPPNSTQEVIRI